MAEISTKKRNALPADKFALPATRQYPIHDAAHVRNAAARLEQNKSSLTPAQYAEAKRNIARVAKKFGVESQYIKPARKAAETTPSPPRSPAGRRRGLHMHLAVSPDGGVSHRIYHANDSSVGGVCMRGEGMAISSIPDTSATLKRLAEVEAQLAAEQDETTRSSLQDEAGKLRVLADEANKPVWIQLAKVGTFKGHSAGPFELNPEIFAQIVKNFEATVNKRIPIDFEHASEEDAAAGSIPVDGAPAQGWILKLENRGAAGLWGLVEWLEPARTYIREGKYKFFSPAIRFGAKDRVTGQPIGARMTSGALTNNPFLDGLAPLAAKDRSAGDHRMDATHTLDASWKHMMDPGSFFPRLKDILKLHPLSSAAECKDHIGKLRALCEMADHPNQMVQGVNLGDYLHPLKAMMNMAEHEATPAQILDAVEEMIEAALAIHEVTEHGDGPMDDAMMRAQELAVKLGAAENAAASLRTEKEGLAAKLRELQSTSDKNLARAITAETELTKLRDEQAKREEQVLEEVVQTRWAAYKDAKKLTDVDLEAMRIEARGNRELFDKRYPPVPPGKEHLLRDLTGGRAALDQRRPQGQQFITTPTGVRLRAVDDPTHTGGVTLSPADMVRLSDKLRKGGMSHEDALNTAMKVAKGQLPLPADYVPGSA